MRLSIFNLKFKKFEHKIYLYIQQSWPIFKSGSGVRSYARSYDIIIFILQWDIGNVLSPIDIRKF